MATRKKPTPPAGTGSADQPAPVETIVGASASDLVALGTTGDVIAAPVLETLTGGASEDVVDVAPESIPVDEAYLRTAHDAIEALLACVGRLRVLDRLEPGTHAKATGALADLKARLGL